MLIISQRNERPDDINYCNHDRGVGGGYSFKQRARSRMVRPQNIVCLHHSPKDYTQCKYTLRRCIFWLCMDRV